MEVRSYLNLASMKNIIEFIDKETGIKIEKYTKYYNNLLPYEEIKNTFLSNPYLLGSKYYELFKATVALLNKELIDLNKVLKPIVKNEDDVQTNIDITNQIKVLNIISKSYNNLYNFIYDNSLSPKYGDEEQNIIKNIINNSSILPIVMLNNKCYKCVKPKSKNIYLTLCPFHKCDTPTFIIIENKHKWECNTCGNSGNIINYMRQAYNMPFYNAIDTLALAFDVKLPDVKTSEDKELLASIKKMLLDSRYLKLVERSLRDTKFCNENMSNDKIIKKYHYHTIQK